MTDPPKHYDAWLAYLFEHPNDREWYFTYGEDVEPFRAANRELIALITHTCLRCGDDLLAYTEAEIADGLSYIFHNGISDTVFSFGDASVPLDERLTAVQSIKTLYRDCLDPRCAPVLSHLDNPGRSSLNLFCYMLWDVTPLGFGRDWTGAAQINDAVVDVLDDALTLPNVACLESALHGLSHLKLSAQISASDQEARIDAVFARFLSAYQSDNSLVRRYVRRYAEAAALGHVQ